MSPKLPSGLRIPRIFTLEKVWRNFSALEVCTVSLPCTKMNFAFTWCLVQRLAKPGSETCSQIPGVLQADTPSLHAELNF